VILLTSASLVARITGVSHPPHRCPVTRPVCLLFSIALTGTMSFAKERKLIARQLSMEVEEPNLKSIFGYL
jgi:hypothetical protein